MRTRLLEIPLCPFNRNLHKEAKFGGASDSIREGSTEASSPATSPPEAQAEAQVPASRTTTLTPTAMSMFLSGKASAEADPVAPSSSSDDVQGLTQMYYLVEEDEAAAATATATAAVSSRAPASEAPAVAAVPFSLRTKRERQQSPQQAGRTSPPNVQQAAFSSSNKERAANSGDVGPSSGGTATSMSTEPQGLTQVFYLDPQEEAEAAAALPVMPRRSFLRERLGVPGEVVQDLRQVNRGRERVW